MRRAPQPSKNAYDTYFPLLFAFKFKIKFDGVKNKSCLICFVGGKKEEEKKKLPASSVFAKKWPENLIPNLFIFFF